MNAPSSPLPWSFPESCQSRTRQSSRSIAAPRVLGAVPSQGMRPILRGSPRRIVRRALLLARPVSVLLGSGLRFQCSRVLCLDTLRAQTDRVDPPGVPHSTSALRTCHTHAIRVSQAEEFPHTLSTCDYVSTVPEDTGRISVVANNTWPMTAISFFALLPIADPMDVVAPSWILPGGGHG